MKKLTRLLTIAASVTFTAAHIGASTPGNNSPETKKTATGSQFLKAAPAANPKPDVPRKSHAFRVNDEKGLLMTCVAPNIDTDANTDVFEDCALAPGRTLDDMMHTFVGAIHYEQNDHERERAEWLKQLEGKDKSSSNTAQK